MHTVVDWANQNNRRWAFTLSNAGSRFFEDRCDLAHLTEIDWNAVQATDWRQCKEGKQAEFLVHHSFPWELVDRIGVLSREVGHHTANAMREATHRPTVEICRGWSNERKLQALIWQAESLAAQLAALTAEQAEYEKARHEKGSATRGMDAQSLAHYFVALCILLGNLVQWTKSRRTVA